MCAEAVQREHRENLMEINEMKGKVMNKVDTIDADDDRGEMSAIDCREADKSSDGYKEKASENQSVSSSYSDSENKDESFPSIAIYCNEYGNAWWGQWGPSSASPKGTGLGGAEEAVLYISREFALMGCV